MDMKMLAMRCREDEGRRRKRTYLRLRLWNKSNMIWSHFSSWLHLIQWFIPDCHWKMTGGTVSESERNARHFSEVHFVLALNANRRNDSKSQQDLSSCSKHTMTSFPPKNNRTGTTKNAISLWYALSDIFLSSYRRFYFPENVLSYSKEE